MHALCSTGYEHNAHYNFFPHVLVSHLTEAEASDFIMKNIMLPGRQSAQK